MTPEPRTRYDYGEREVAAARRVLVDLGQVLGSFLTESVVVVGGWVPDLLLIGAGERHVGSIDVDLALDVERLREGRYAEIVKAMLATGRYRKTDKEFKLQAEVDLGDGGPKAGREPRTNRIHSGCRWWQSVHAERSSCLSPLLVTNPFWT